MNSPGKHKVVDLFVLLILHSTANRKKAVESLIRNKIKNGHFTEEMLTAAFNSHSQVRLAKTVLVLVNPFQNVKLTTSTIILCFCLQILRGYFSDLLSLAEILLRSPDPSVCSYACTMYKLSFVSFDLYCKQVH